jgi:hypothetical protein
VLGLGSWRRRVVAVVIACICALTVLSGVAQACGPGKRHKYLVASGLSLHGVSWRITAQRAGRGDGQYVSVDFKTIGYPESGFGAFLPWPPRVPPSFFDAIGGSYTDPPPESDLAGFTGKRVALITVSMETGETVNINPQPAPQKLRTRICWMRRMRFFDTYFEGAPVPVRATAFDAAGQVLGSKKANRGSFF